MRTFEYANPESLNDVLGLLGADGDGAVRPLAGGTDLLPLMKADVAAPSRLVNIKGLPDLTGIRDEGADGLVLGALTTLTELETDALIGERYPVLQQAAAVAATPQLRNMATVGGNLLQRSRCWYFRNPRFHCWLKGGEECQARDGENRQHAILGGGPCWSAHPSDIPVALIALDAGVQLRGPAGERTMSVGEFFALPSEERRTETVLGSDELVLSVRIPATDLGTRSIYLKAMDRKVWAFSLVSVAAVLRMEGQRIRDARIVLGGSAPIPWRATAAEDVLTGETAGPELFARAADAALLDAVALRDNGYKIPLARTLIQRALAAAAN